LLVFICPFHFVFKLFFTLFIWVICIHLIGSELGFGYFKVWSSSFCVLRFALCFVLKLALFGFWENGGITTRNIGLLLWKSNSKFIFFLFLC
jgi:hypothetical protein